MLQMRGGFLIMWASGEAGLSASPLLTPMSLLPFPSPRVRFMLNFIMNAILDYQRTGTSPSSCLVASLVAQMVKRLSAVQETQVQPLGWEDPLEKEITTHSSTLAWKIPWTVEPGRLQSMGSQRVRHN